MKFMLLIYMAEDAMTGQEREKCYLDSTQLAKELHASGAFVSANPLQSVTAAKSVRVRQGKMAVTDGPYAEAREYLGGYFLIEAKDLDAALAVAARIPGATKGTVEVRPVYELQGLPG